MAAHLLWHCHLIHFDRPKIIRRTTRRLFHGMCHENVVSRQFRRQSSTGCLVRMLNWSWIKHQTLGAREERVAAYLLWHCCLIHFDRPKFFRRTCCSLPALISSSAGLTYFPPHSILACIPLSLHLALATANRSRSCITNHQTVDGCPRA